MSRVRAALAASLVSLSAAVSLASSGIAVAASASAPDSQAAPNQLPHGLRLPIPRTPEHTEFIVETNKKGQVVKVDSGKQCQNRTFNAFTYGNALQAFIRTPDGHAIAGFYRLTYDFDPKTLKVRRDVELVKAGGVNPDAQGAVDAMADVAKRTAARDAAEAAKKATPLPNFRDITGHK